MPLLKLAFGLVLLQQTTIASDVQSFENAVHRFGLDLSKYTPAELDSYRSRFVKYQNSDGTSNLHSSDADLERYFRDAEPLQTDYKVKVLQEHLIHTNAPWSAGKQSVWGSDTITGSDFLSVGDAKYMQGYQKSDPNQDRVQDVYSYSNMTIPISEIPDKFDSRTHDWGHKCPSLTHVRNQAVCGSCWAHGTTEAYNDRVCIATGKSELLSVEQIASCCTLHTGCFSFGCQGGDTNSGWWFLTTKGVVTGGDYHADNLCWDYDINPAEKFDHKTPKCRKTCENSKYPKSFHTDQKDHYFPGSNTYKLKGRDAIKENLMKYGPVTAAFTVYDDFKQYTGGVYTGPVPGSKVLGGHAIKIVGWGADATVKEGGYWIVQNSWGGDWGLDGYFWIEFGSSTGIDEEVVAGSVGGGKRVDGANNKDVSVYI